MRFKPSFEDQNLGLLVLWVTEIAALEAAIWRGRENNTAADHAATGAMRDGLETVPICGTVVNGEGEMDMMSEEGRLVVGERVGMWREGDPEVDVSVDPLECTSACALNEPGSVTVIAFAEKGNFLHVPDMYMYKIAVGPAARGVIDITLSVTENLRRIAQAKKVNPSKLTVAVLNRPKHFGIIQEICEIGAQVKTLASGDLMAAVATARPGSGIDVLIGEGGAPEGVLAAAALRCLGGDIQGILRPESTEEDPILRANLIMRTEAMTGRPVSKPLRMYDLAKGNVVFAATGVTDGPMLRGVRHLPNGTTVTHSIVTRSLTHTFMNIKREHPSPT